MRGLRPRRAAMAALKATVTPASPRSFSSRGLHAAAMGADQPVVEEAEIRQVLGRQPVAVRLDGRDLAPDLVEMDGGPGAELLLQRAQVAAAARASTCRAPRPRRRCGCGPSALPFHLREGVLDGREMALAQRAVELEGRRIADRGAGPVVGALAQQEAHAGCRPAPRHSRRRRWNPRARRWCRCAAPPARPVAPSRAARRGSCRAGGSATGRRRRAACAAATGPRTRRAPGSW